MRTATAEIARLGDERSDPAARARARKLAGETLGSLELLRICQAQVDYLDAPNSTAALDSELALLWWDYYPASSWYGNPLHYQTTIGSNAPRTVMVMRLDAPDPLRVRQMILATLRAERDGLKGRVVLDSRGLPAGGEKGSFGGFGWYDQSIRNLAELVGRKTKLALLHDDAPEVLAAGSAQDVAVYCGWYSLRKYVPSCQFSPGAVGFHVASFELETLREEPGRDRRWVQGLIDDGVVATVGAVAEPYLASFPPADEFFPLLLTGRLTLAEAYWKTVPMTSWMLTAIGDPLYTPYRRTPALAVEDLPPRLGVIFRPSTTRPTTRPGGH